MHVEILTPFICFGRYISVNILCFQVWNYLFTEIFLSYDFITIWYMTSLHTVPYKFPQGKMNQYQNLCDLSLTYIAVDLKYM